MKKLILPLLAAFAILLCVGLFATSDGATARYVSAPLTDGSRYTFLYPRRLDVERGDASGCYLRGPNRSASATDRLLVLLPGRRKMAASSGMVYEEIRISVSPREKAISDSRSNVVGRNSQWLSVEDARSRAFFLVEHQGYGADPSLFKADSAVLNQSFRVLTPGERVPE